jgi:hypothetical protein
MPSEFDSIQTRGEMINILARTSFHVPLHPVTSAPYQEHELEKGLDRPLSDVSMKLLIKVGIGGFIRAGVGQSTRSRNQSTQHFRFEGCLFTLQLHKELLLIPRSPRFPLSGI